MKKNGFTLAEVLITLAIIGVVATLTLPSLMTNTQEQQAMTAYKKILNSLNEAGQMNAALEGFDYASADAIGSVDDNIADGAQTIGALINERMQVTDQSRGDTFGNCANAMVLRDATTICLAQNGADADYRQIWVDTNGPKGPNRASTCGDENCQVREDRHINDQFHVTLHRGVAMPGWNTADGEGNTAGDFAAYYAMGISSRNHT